MPPAATSAPHHRSLPFHRQPLATTASQQQAVQEHLRALPFAQYAACIAQLLRAMGYKDVRLLGATHGKGRNQHGGLDLEAYSETGVTRARVIAQIKQYPLDRAVPRAFVDELRGAGLRLGAQQALIVTTGAFSQAAQEAARTLEYSLPVRLVEGKELVALLLRYGIALPASSVGSEKSQRREALSTTQPGELTKGGEAAVPPPLPPSPTASVSASNTAPEPPSSSYLAGVTLSLSFTPPKRSSP